jgi:recombination protein RecA
MDATARHRLLDAPSTGRSPAWSLAALAGRLVELSGWKSSAVLTAAFGLVLEAQRRGEPTAWVTLRKSTFFPPDAAEGGVDLAALAVVRVPDPPTAARTADRLVRSGGLGLVVVDLGPDPYPNVPVPLQSRLAGLAQKHATAVVVLTEKPADAPSLGSLVSLRAEARRAEEHAVREVRVTVLKDKRLGPGRVHRETCHGPAGLG